MRVCFALPYYPDSIIGDPQGALDRVPLLRYLPRELVKLGHDVDVVHLAPDNARHDDGGARHHFVASGRLARGGSRLVGAALRREPAFYEPALAAARKVHELSPQVVHFHGTVLHLNLGILSLVERLRWPTRARRKHAPPLVVQHHGGAPSSNAIVRGLQRRLLARADRLLFTCRDHATPFVEAGVLSPDDERVVEIIETSSHFRPMERSEARQVTGMTGKPVLLSAARLHPLKDPMTTLRAFEQIVAVFPRARLYLCYRSDELFPELETFVARRPQLAERVHFRGRVDFEQMEAVYNSADILLQASTREFSGCAILEAMACGVIPVLSDIPAFRVITGHGRCGALFPPGDADALAAAVLQIPPAEIPFRSTRVRAYFDDKLSFSALAHRLESLYTEVMGDTD